MLLQWWPLWLLVSCIFIVLSWILWKRSWVRYIFQGIFSTMQLWAVSFWIRLKSGEGYVLLVTFIGTYVGLYTIQMGRHELLANRATFERSTFITMVSSGNRGAFIAAMKDFGRIQNMEISIEPSLFKLWSWFFVKYRPNKIPLYFWDKFFLTLCTSDMCGEPSEESKSFRINLFQADLHKAFFGTDRLSFIESINKLGSLSEDALHLLGSEVHNKSGIKNDGIL